MIEVTFPNASVGLRSTKLSNWTWPPCLFFPKVFYQDSVTRWKLILNLWWCVFLSLFSEATQWSLDFLEPVVSAADENWSSPQTLFQCSSLLLLMAKPVALSIGCWRGFKIFIFLLFSNACRSDSKSPISPINVFEIFTLVWTIWYVYKDLVWRAELCLCRFQLVCQLLLSMAPNHFHFRVVLWFGCFFDYTRLCITSAWSYPR